MQFANSFAAKLSLPLLSHIGQSLLPALLEKPSLRFERSSTGTCTCGRRALVLARCIHCAKLDLGELEEAEEPAEQAEVAALVDSRDQPPYK